jgi:hypothetical protein
MKPLTATLALAVSVALAGCSSPVDAPKSYDKFVVKDGAFSCKAPKGWNVEQGARPDNTYSWAKFTKNDVQIKVMASVGGSLLADPMKAANANNPHAESPTAFLHERGKKDMQEEFSGYKEGEPKKIETSLGEGRQATFVASGSLGSSIKGYRATLLSNDRQVTVVCQCPAAEWKTLQRAFNEVIKSMSNGR